MGQVEVLDHSGHCRTLGLQNVVAVRWTGPVERGDIHRSLSVVADRGRRNPQNLVILFEVASRAVRPSSIFYARDQFIGVSPNVRAIGVCVHSDGALGGVMRALATAAAATWRARWDWRVFASVPNMAAWASPFVDGTQRDRQQLERMFSPFVSAGVDMAAS